MAGRRLSGWSVGGPERLADLAAALVAERRPERLPDAVVRTALAATGGTAARLVRAEGAPLAVAGAPPDRPPDAAADLKVARGAPARVEVWGAPPDPAADAALRLVVAAAAAAVDLLAAESELGAARRRAGRRAAAVAAVREPAAPRRAVARLLSEARALAGADAAVLTAPGGPAPELATCDGTDPLSQDELAAVLPPDRASALAGGASWRGRLDPGSPLGARGFAGAAAVPVGPAAAAGILLVLSLEAPPHDDVLEDLAELAAAAGAALTASVLGTELRELGAVDPLTRFFNQRYFSGRLDQECQRALRTGAPVSVAVLRLDRAPALRAAGRTAAAEQALEALGAHVAARLRAMDVGCRVGDDELAAILPEVEGLEAYRVGERLRASLRSDAVLGDEHTLSVGVASFPDQASSPEELAARARVALEWAARQGGGRTAIFHRDTAELMAGEAGGDDSALSTVAAIAAAVDARHPLTRHHSQNVARLAALLSAELGLPPERVEDVRVAGLLHDVGKAGLREDLVVAPGPLSETELEELRAHPEIGERMLTGPRLAEVRPWVLHHHERFDGTGYPAGLAGEAIPLEARIIAVADRFDHLVSGRPGRMPVGAHEAMAEIERRAGGELDPGVVAALRALVGRGAPGVVPAAG